MNFILYQQFPEKPHKGGKIKKPKPIDGYINIGDDKKAVFFNKLNYMAAAPLMVNVFRISQNGIHLAGVQSDDNIRFWWQEWFLTNVL